MNLRLGAERIVTARSERAGGDPAPADDAATDGSYLQQLVKAVGGRLPDGSDLTDFDRAALQAVDRRLRAMSVERGRKAAEEALVQVLDILRVQEADQPARSPIVAHRPIGAVALPRRNGTATLRARRR